MDSDGGGTNKHHHHNDDGHSHDHDHHHHTSSSSSHNEGMNAGGSATKKRQGRPSNSLVWENVQLETIKLDDGTTTVMQQTCVHCKKVNRANKPQTTWWAVHLVDRGPKGCPNAPISVRHAILNTTSSQQVRDAGIGLNSPNGKGRGGGGGRGRAGLPPIPSAGVKRGLSKLLEDNILVEEVSDGNLSQTCRHCKKNRTCKQTLATVWSKHFVDISPKGCPDAPFYVRRAIAAESSSAEVKRLAESQGWFLELRRDGMAGNNYAAPGGKNGAEEEGDQKQRSQKRAKSSQDTCSEPPDGCCQAQADGISIKIMEFLTACGHSMMLVQSPVFLDLLRSLNQAYVERYLTKADVFVKTWLPKLFQSVQKQLGNLWNDQQRKQQCLATLGLWGGPEEHHHAGGPTGKIITETLQGSKVAFWNTVTVNEEVVTSSAISNVLANHMIAMAGGDESKVTSTYGAIVVTTDDDVNVQVGDSLQERFPLLFVNRCRLQAMVEIRAAIFSVPEIARVAGEAQFIAHFILDDATACKIFSRHFHGVPSPAASQDFDEIMRLLESLVSGSHEHCHGHNLGNGSAERYLSLTQDDEWVTAAAEKMDLQMVQRFETLVSDGQTFARFEALNKLMRPLALLESHLKRPNVRASWIYPLFHALQLDVKEWCDSGDVKQAFQKEETVDELNSAIQRCWRGTQDRPGLFAPHILLAMLLDPTTCPNGDNLPDDWDNDSEEVLKRFYSGKELLDAQAELMTLLDHQGKFGREVERYQEALKTAAPHAGDCQLHVQQVVDRQLPATDMKPHLAWKLSLKSSFPLLQPIACRVLVMGSSSVDAGWTSKLRKALHASAHASPVLAENKVLMLLYCHFNLRVIQHSKSSETDAGVDGISSFDEFLGQALLDNTAAATAGREVSVPDVEQSDGCSAKGDGGGCKADEADCCC